MLIVAAFSAVWFMFPAPDTRHDLVSPSGAVRIELAELCGENGCNRVAILDAAGTRTGCPLSQAGNVPIFADVWLADESVVKLNHVAADGGTGSLELTLMDCTISQQ